LFVGVGLANNASIDAGHHLVDDSDMRNAIPGILPDILDTGLEVVFCGINPGMRAAASGRHFCGRNNRFWKVLHLAGYTAELLTPENDREILRYRCGLTTVVERPTAKAAEVARHEFVVASVKLRKKIEICRPRNIAFLGKAAYAAITGVNEVQWGLQPTEFVSGVSTWVLPNPSGLNRRFSLDDLVPAYAQILKEKTRRCGAVG
jgi:TDG/mug DNA glycosylase family protein